MDLLATWPLPHRTDLRDRLVAAYSTARGYHDLRHLTEVLQRLGELGAAADREVVLAAWYHDAMYDGAGDDEERSALLAESDLADEAVDATEVARLVRLTATHRPGPGDHRGEVLCDADLAILASGPERYREYVDGVRREYAALSTRDFARGRRALLRDLLGQPSLFATAHARAHWEQPARANLAREVDELTRALGDG